MFINLKFLISSTLIIFIPLFLCISFILFGRFLGTFGMLVLVFFSYSILLLCAFTVCYFTLMGYVLQINLFSWFSIFYQIEFGFFFDFLSSTMSSLIILISFLIIIYSFEYMGNDPHLNRFISYLNLFVLFMLIFVCSSNLTQMFLGWEGVGVVSFLLVSFWFTRLEACRSALKAVLFNKVGDIFFLISIIILFDCFKTTNFLIIFDLLLKNNQLGVSLSYGSLLFYFSVCLIIAAFAKSAQFILFAWLPDAMEGPTPVSALLHSATMVTAGVFLLLRFSSIILEFDNFYYLSFMLLSSFTSLFSGICAYLAFDIKKIIAFSTCSQLGFLFTIFFFGHPLLCYYHLINHAFFKAMLFLIAGLIIHFFNNEQDIRKMRGSIFYFVFFIFCLLVGSFSLMGFPFLSGFYSKEVSLLTLVVEYNNFYYFFIFCMMLLSLCFSCLYSYRLLYVFVSFKFLSFNISKDFKFFFFFCDNSQFCVLILVFLSILSGFLLEDIFVSLSNQNFIYWTTIFGFKNQLSLVVCQRELLESFGKLFYIFLIVFLLGFFYYTNVWNCENLMLKRFERIDYFYKFVENLKKINTFFFSSFFLYIYMLLYNLYSFIVYTLVFKTLDRGFFEFYGPTGVVIIVRTFGLYLLNIFSFNNKFVFLLFSIVFFIFFYFFFSYLNLFFSVIIALLSFFFLDGLVGGNKLKNY